MRDSLLALGGLVLDRQQHNLELVKHTLSAIWSCRYIVGVPETFASGLLRKEHCQSSILGRQKGAPYVGAP